MLQFTAEEATFLADLVLRQDCIQKLGMEVRTAPQYYNVPVDQRDTVKAENEDRQQRLNELRKETAELEGSRVAIRVALKKEFNATLAQKLPGGEMGALLDVANEILAWMTTDPNVVGSAQLAKNVVILGLNTFNDPEVHAARARGVFLRYTALTDAGLPEPLVHGILIAEAGRSLPTASMKTK